MRKRADSRPVDGILLVDKPGRIGSNAVLQHVRRLYRAERAGHTGTLDPMASGLLIACFGEATKFAGELLDSAKTYRARITLGVTTATGDAEGEVLEQRPVSADEQQLAQVLARFRGPILQVPPMHSALKRDGKPLYEYARRGETVPREARPVTIYSLELFSAAFPDFEIEVNCSKGTYVRTLAEDIGQALGCGAHLSGLVRTRIGAFDLSEAHSPEMLGGSSPEERDRLLLPADRILTAYPRVLLDPAEARRFSQGQPVVGSATSHGLVRVYGDGGARFLGTGWSETGGLRPRRLLATAA
jgi:tRNA pseudouridine55 synthase